MPIMVHPGNIFMTVKDLTPASMRSKPPSSALSYHVSTPTTSVAAKSLDTILNILLIMALYCPLLKAPSSEFRAQSKKNLCPTRYTQRTFGIYSLSVIQTEMYSEVSGGQRHPTLIHYPIPPHKQKAYKEWRHMNLPITEKIHKEVLSLPMSPVLMIKEIAFMVKKINQFT